MQNRDTWSHWWQPTASPPLCGTAPSPPGSTGPGRGFAHSESARQERRAAVRLYAGRYAFERAHATECCHGSASACGGDAQRCHRLCWQRVMSSCDVGHWARILPGSLKTKSTLLSGRGKSLTLSCKHVTRTQPFHSQN